jgi:hypothetical protein
LNICIGFGHPIFLLELFDFYRTLIEQSNQFVLSVAKLEKPIVFFLQELGLCVLQNRLYAIVPVDRVRIELDIIGCQYGIVDQKENVPGCRSCFLLVDSISTLNSSGSSSNSGCWL